MNLFAWLGFSLVFEPWSLNVALAGLELVAILQLLLHEYYLVCHHAWRPVAAFKKQELAGHLCLGCQVL